MNVTFIDFFLIKSLLTKTNFPYVLNFNSVYVTPTYLHKVAD